MDKALSMKPQEILLLHMRGRFLFAVASLSWIERKTASAFFAVLPQATFNDAIADFLEVYFLKLNCFYLKYNLGRKNEPKFLDTKFILFIEMLY